MPEKDLSLHWNKVYKRTQFTDLGWYEERPEPSLRLIEKCKLDKNSTILNVGAGAGTLIDELLRLGYTNIIANDLSMQALETLKGRLGESSESVKWIVDDLTKPIELNKLQALDLWHDRAVLHFFTELDEQDAYFKLIEKLLKPGGFVIIAAFNLHSAEKCSELPVHRYDVSMIQPRLGKSFELQTSFDHTYTMPSGDTREYVYTLFRRKPS